MKKCPKCGAPWVSGACPASAGWCKADCDLQKSNPPTGDGWYVALCCEYISPAGQVTHPDAITDSTISGIYERCFEEPLAMAAYLRSRGTGEPSVRIFFVTGMTPRIDRLSGKPEMVLYLGYDLFCYREITLAELGLT